MKNAPTAASPCNPCAAGAASLYSELYSRLAAVYSAPKHLADLVKLLRGETHHSNMLAHMNVSASGAAEKALVSIATGKNPEDPAAAAIWRALMSERHPLSDPDNLARAVILGSDTFSEEVLEKGYRSAAANIHLALRGLAELIYEEEVYKARIKSVLTAPGLLLPERYIDSATIQAMGYSARPEQVYIPFRSCSEERLATVVRHLHRPTGLEGLQRPEEISANLLAAAIIQAVLENRYTLAIYATADALAGGGGMTVAGPARMPLLAGSGELAKVLKIVELLFRAAGHRRVKVKFLQKYLLKINELIRDCEALAGRRLDVYDLRGFWEQGELVQRVRADALAVERGGEPENTQELVRKESNPFKILEPLHLYLSATPYFTADQARRLERVTMRATALALLSPHVPKTTYTDRTDYMTAKRRLCWEVARILTANLVPAHAHVAGEIRGIDRLVWSITANPPE